MSRPRANEALVDEAAQWMALPFCLTARYFVWAAPACLAMEGGASVLLIFYLIEC